MFRLTGVKSGLLVTLLSAAVSLSAAELSDPTRPQGFQAGVPEGDDSAAISHALELSGIFTGPGGSSAVINGKRVKVGDRIAGGHITAVERQYVEIQRGGDSFRLDLLPLRVKQPVEDNAGGER